MSCLVRTNRYKAVLSQDDKGHGVVQDVLDLFQGRWGSRFGHDLSKELLQKEMEVWAPGCSLAQPRSGGSEIRIFIELRSMGGYSVQEFLRTLSDSEFCLSVAEVATQLSPDSKVLLPEHLVLVCGGGSLPALPDTFGELMVVGCRNMVPVLTISTKDGVRKLELDVVESASRVKEAFVPVGTFRED